MRIIFDKMTCYPYHNGRFAGGWDTRDRDMVRKINETPFVRGEKFRGNLSLGVLLRGEKNAWMSKWA